MKAEITQFGSRLLGEADGVPRHDGPVDPATGSLRRPSVQARLLRVFPPLTILIIFAHSFLSEIFDRVFPANQTLMSVLLALVFAFIMGVVVILVARRIGRDIDRAERHRKAAEDAVRESQQTLRFVLDAVPVRLFWKDRNLVYTGCNSRFAQDAGLATPEEILGKNDFELGWKDQARLYREDDTTVMTTGRPKLNYEEPQTTPDGCKLWLRTSKIPLRDHGGRVVGVLGIYEDITEHRQAEEEIRKLNEDLELRVAERTAQLEATNRELEAFCYSVSHDLRAPLRSIDGFSRLIQEDCGDNLNEQGNDYLNRVRGASHRMAQLIDDLLNLSRITRSRIACTSIDLSAMAEAIVAELRKNEPARAVDVRIAPGLTAVADENLLRIALENLLGNAWKFTRKRPDARIELGTVQQDGKRVFFIRDNGAGFNMAYAGKLFGAFQRLHSEKEFEGTGVGLATVQRIIHRHGGKIWAEGQVDQGATFYFTL